jgi:hypothetical protein
MAGRLPSESVVAFASESLAAFHRKTQPAARRVQAVTLRVYAYAYALVRRTMRSHLTAGACGSPGPGGDPAGLCLHLVLAEI